MLAYEKPEADVLLRKPRKVGVERLVDWKLMVHAYGFVGVLQTVTSFAMAYWYLTRKGILFSELVSVSLTPCQSTTCIFKSPRYDGSWHFSQQATRRRF